MGPEASVFQQGSQDISYGASKDSYAGTLQRAVVFLERGIVEAVISQLCGYYLESKPSLRDSFPTSRIFAPRGSAFIVLSYFLCSPFGVHSQELRRRPRNASLYQILIPVLTQIITPTLNPTQTITLTIMQTSGQSKTYTGVNVSLNIDLDLKLTPTPNLNPTLAPTLSQPIIINQKLASMQTLTLIVT